jgi:tRNA modification GTPase
MECKAKDELSDRAMLLTPSGVGAIAVIRLRGLMVESFLREHFSKPAEPGRCVHGTLRDGDRIIDDPVIVLSDDRATADINLHGGEWIVRECLNLARRVGFQVVENCEEFLDAQSEIEREMLVALPLARTEQTIRALLAQSNLWSEFVHKPGLQARVGSPGDPDVNVRLARIIEDESLWWMLHPPRVAIVGIPNVGKSTLANQLFGQQRSITADIPGTTRDWVGDFANLDGLPIHLLDTPGQRESSDTIEQTAIARSEKEIAQADLIILVFDPTQPKSSQEAIAKRYPNALVVINKSDLPTQWQPPDGLRIIATRGEGIPQFIAKIRKHFHCDDRASDRMRWWTKRQREFLRGLLYSDQKSREMS